MAKCDVRVQVDRGDRVYRPGDVVTGHVHINVNKSVQCDALKVTLMWRTHGKGNTERGSKQELVVATGERWEPGVRQYPFRYTLPAGPVTYHGGYLNVDWYVVAEVDVPWAWDPEGEIDLVLEPAPPKLAAGTAYRERKLEPVHHELGLAKSSGRAPVGCILAAFALFFGPFMYVMIAESDDVIGVAVFGAIATLLFIGAVARRIMNNMARRALGKVSIDLSDETARAGERIEVTFNIAPEKEANVDGLNVKLTGKEIVVKGSGTNKKTYTNVLHSEQRAVCAERRVIRPGQTLRLSGVLAIPKQAAPTFRSSDNKVKWEVEAHIDIPRWPDLVEKYEIDVQPS